MFFKKKKISQKSILKGRNYGPILAGIGAFFMGFVGIQAMSGSILSALESSQILPIQDGKIIFTHEISNQTGYHVPDNTSNMTYILLVGRGGGNHDAPNLTDTIILLGINKQAKNISMLSIPRDLWVNYPNNTSGKINGIYATELKNGTESAIQSLEDKITEITGKEIDYYVNIDFEGFKEVINALGGVEVTVDENLVDYEYPDGYGGYKTFILRKGTWTLDGDVALMYARSRHSTSDFDRSLRQQQILSAIKEKVSNLGYLSDTKTILELYNIFNTYVETDLSLTDIMKLGLTIKSWGNSQFLSFNLNDTCYTNSPICTTGGFLFTPQREYFGGASVLLPNAGTISDYEEFNEIQDFSTLIFEHPEIYSILNNMYIFNNSGIGGLANDLSESMKPYGIIIPQSNLQSYNEKNFENGFLQYNNIRDKDSILSVMNNFFSGSLIEAKNPSYNSGAQIEIMLTSQNEILK